MFRLYQIILIFIIITVLALSSIFIKDFRIDASSDTLVAQNDKDFKYFNFYKNIFPSKNSLIIAIKSSKQIDEKLLYEIDNITEKFSKIPEVASVFNINKAPILFLNNTRLIELSNDNYETILNTNFPINDVLNEFANSPIYSDQIINPEKNVTSIIIFLEKNYKLLDLIKNKNEHIKNNKYFKIKSEIDEDRSKLVKKIREIIKDSNNEYEYYLGGIEMISSDVISFVKDDIILFSLIVLTLVILILFIIFRNIKWVFVILITSMISVFIMIGLAGFLNFEITAVSANFISLMFILSISMNIHILNNYLQSDNTLGETLKFMFWPCFYTFLTTVVAFLSLVLSDIKPIIDFGLVMIISLIVVIVTSFLVMPLIISFFSKENFKFKLKFSLISNALNLSTKFKKTIILINIIFFSISIYGVSNLNVENSFIKYFKKNTEIYKGMKLIDTHLGGTTPLDIILEFENEIIIDSQSNDEEFQDEEDIEFEEDIFTDDLFSDDSNIWFTKNKIEKIKKIHEYLESRNEIGKVISIYSLIDIANEINKNELSSFELSVLYNEIPEEYKTDLIDPYLNIDKNMVKISARVKDSEDIKRSQLIDEISYYINNLTDKDFKFKINGLLVLYNNMLSSLFSSQIKSLGFVILAIFIMFLVLFRSFKLSLAGIIPNILASTYILGLIGLLRMPLDIMTITIAAISIGIAVDNTIHYLYKYKSNKIKNLSFIESIESSHLSVGKAVFITSITISIGFLTLGFSNFVPTIIFGIFTSLAMLFAMIGVLITLPSILYYFK